MLNMIEKVNDIARDFVQFDEPSGRTYHQEKNGRTFEAEVRNLLFASPITAFSIVNTHDACNSGVISVAFVDVDGTLRHENYPWWEEC